MSGSGIRWAICTLPQTDNHAKNPPLSFFSGQMPFLPPIQQRQSTEDTMTLQSHSTNCVIVMPFIPSCMPH